MDKKVIKSFNIAMILIIISGVLIIIFKTYTLFIAKRIMESIITGFLGSALLVCLFGMRYLLKELSESE